MRTETVEEVCARIDAAEKRRPGGAVAFDGDGTLWSGDIAEDLFDALLTGNELTPIAREALAREAAAERLDAAGSAVELARRIHAAYYAGSFPEERVCEIMTWLCAGWTKSRIDAFAAATLERVRLVDRFQEETVRVLRHCERAGIQTFIVSASPRTVVEAAARLLGVDIANVLSVREVCDGSDVVTADVHRPIPYGAGKATLLRAKLEGRALHAALGDNAFDVPMLAAAEIPVMIRPKPRLLALAAELPAAVVLR